MTNTQTANTDPRKPEDEMNIDELFAAAEYEKYSIYKLMDRAWQLENDGDIEPRRRDELQAHINSFEMPKHQTPWHRRPPTVRS